MGDLNKRRSVLKPLQAGDTVRIQPLQPFKREWQQATVSRRVSGRTYDVVSDDGRQYRRNRQFLRKTQRSRPANLPQLASGPLSARSPFAVAPTLTVAAPPSSDIPATSSLPSPSAPFAETDRAPATDATTNPSAAT